MSIIAPDKLIWDNFCYFYITYHVSTNWNCISMVIPVSPLKIPYNPKYWDTQAWANIADPDKMPYYVASDQGLHCLSLVHQF